MATVPGVLLGYAASPAGEDQAACGRLAFHIGRRAVRGGKTACMGLVRLGISTEQLEVLHRDKIAGGVRRLTPKPTLRA